MEPPALHALPVPVLGRGSELLHPARHGVPLDGRLPCLGDSRAAHRASGQRPELPGQPALLHRVSVAGADRAHRRHVDRHYDRHGGRADPRVTRRQLRRLVRLQQLLRRPRRWLVPRRLRGVCRPAHPGHRVPVGRDQDPHLGGDRTVHEPGLVSDRVLPAHLRARTGRRGGRLLLPQCGGDRAAGGADTELDEQHMEHGVSGGHEEPVHLSVAVRVTRQ